MHWWENVLKGKQVVHQNFTLVHLVLILPTEGQILLLAAWGHSTFSVSSCQCPFPPQGPQPASAGSVCHIAPQNWVETQPLQCSFISVHCIKFPAFHRIIKVGRSLHDQLVQPPAQQHLNHPQLYPLELHPEHFQNQWLHRVVGAFLGLGKH